MINEHDRVVLTTTMAGEGLEAGDVGTVVHVSRDGLAFEVELTTLGKTAAVVTVEAAQVRPMGNREITHAHQLAPLNRRWPKIWKPRRANDNRV